MKHCAPTTPQKQTRTGESSRGKAALTYKRRFLMLMICVLVWMSFSGSSTKNQYLNAKQGVVMVNCYVAEEQTGNRLAKDGYYLGGSGTGFFVGETGKNPEYLITNHHVIEDYLEYGSGERTAYATSSGNIYARSHVDVYFDSKTFLQAYVVAYNEVTDLAVLRLSEPTSLRVALTLLEPTQDMVGSTVYAFGFPGISDNRIAEPISQSGINDMTVNRGVVSRLLTTSGTGVRKIQTDVTIQHGNSGGPMTDELGRVIGVNSWGVGNGEEETKYACSISEAVQLLRQNGIPFTLATDVEVAPATEAPTEAPTTAPTEAPTTAPATEPPTTLPPETTTAPVPPTTVPPEPDTNWLLYGIIALVVVGVIVVVVVLITSSKKKNVPPPVPVNQPGPNYNPGPSTATGAFAPQTNPVRAQPTTATAHETGATSLLSRDAGATTVLNQGASETTILTQKVNGGTLVRKRDGSKIEINADGFTIGRERAKVTYCISDNTSISRVHVKFSVRNGTTYIQDQKAANGTFVNGNKLTPMQDLALKSGDKVTLADEEFEFRI